MTWMICKKCGHSRIRFIPGEGFKTDHPDCQGEVEAIEERVAIQEADGIENAEQDMVDKLRREGL